MANITSSWTTVASKTWKSGNFSATFYLQARVNSQSIANNQSVIQTRLRSVRNSYTFSGYPYKFTCSYCTAISGNSMWTVETENILTSPNKTIGHNSNGSKSITLSATASITGLGLSISLSGTAVLPSIPRSATITAAPNFTDLDNPTITYSNPAGNSVTTLQASIYMTDGMTGLALYRNISKTGTKYTFNLTDEERNRMRQYCVNSKSMTVSFYVRTVLGGVTYNKNVDRTLTIIDANPTFNATYEDTNASSIAITQNNQLLIQNQSTLQINITNATAYKYATLSSIKATINGVTYNGTLDGSNGVINVGALNIAENTDAVVTLTDSRGYTVTQTLNLQFLGWQLPTANITLQRQNNYYSETDIKVDANYSSLDDKNTITIQARYKKQSDDTWSSYITLQDNVTSTLTLDNKFEWDVQVVLTDLLGTTTYNLTLDIGMPIIFFDRLKRSVAVNSFPSNTSSFEVQGGDILEIIGDKTDTWSSSGSYAKDSFVTYERYIYQNQTGTNSGTPDSDTTNWKKVSVLDLIKSVEAGGGSGTTNYNDLGNKPSINGVTLSGNKTTSDLGITIPTSTSQLTNNSGFITNTVNNLTNYTKTTDLSAVATSGSYNDLSDKPTIPSYSEATTTTSGLMSSSDKTKLDGIEAGAEVNEIEVINVNGTPQRPYNKEVDITIPTMTSQLTNNSGFITGITSSDVTTALGYTPQEEITSSNKLDYSLLDNTPNIGNAKTYYGVCNTGAYVGTKEVTISDFVLETGAIVTIKFTYGNEYTNTPLLKINDNDAKYLKIASNTLTYRFGGGSTKSFVYDGTDFILIEPSPATSSNYGLVKTSTSVSSSSNTDVATSSAVKQAYDLANSKQDEITSTNKLDYSLIDNAPTIPTKTSDLTNDSGFITSSYHDSTKQDTLVSGTNIKTINGTSLLGSGNISIGGGGTATDVQVNGTSITSGGVANILTNSSYSSSNKIATMSDIPTNVSELNNDSNYATTTEVQNVDNKIGTLSNLDTTTKTDLVSAINEIFEKNIITVGLTANTNVSIRATWTHYQLALNDLDASLGSKLTFDSSNHRITVGDGVSYVKVNAYSLFRGITGSIEMDVRKNGTSIGATAVQTSNTSAFWNGAITDILVPVSSGDYFDISFRASATGTVVAAGVGSTKLTVEVVQ